MALTDILALFKQLRTRRNFLATVVMKHFFEALTPSSSFILQPRLNQTNLVISNNFHDSDNFQVKQNKKCKKGDGTNKVTCEQAIQ